MKSYRIITGYEDEKSKWDTHYIECNTIEQISAFAVKIEGQFVIIFMNPIMIIELYKEVV